MLGMSVSPGVDVHIPGNVVGLGEETGDVHVLRLGKFSGPSVEADDAVEGPGDGTGNVQVQGLSGSSDDSEGTINELHRLIDEKVW